MRQLLGFTVLLVLCACGGSNQSPSSIDGTWSATSQVVGSNLMMNLILRNTDVSGTGTYAIEAGRSGSLVVTGQYQTQINLSFAYDYGVTASYVATLTDQNHMSGKLIFPDSTSSDVTFVRQ